jgi:hypothetical protein
VSPSGGRCRSEAGTRGAPIFSETAQSGGGKKEKAWEKMKICRFHYRYGAAATRCDTGCSFVAEN